MSYRSLERACEYYYNPDIRARATKRHGGIYYLSSGVNHLRPPRAITDKIAQEVKERSFITSYPSQGGALLLLAAVAFDLRQRLGPEIGRQVDVSNVCITVGGTGALTNTFRYLTEHTKARRVLVLGLNYSFFSLLCDRFGFEYSNLLSAESGRILPTIDEVRDAIKRTSPDIVIMSQPTNPSGEVYAKDEFSALMELALELNFWFLIDEVPNLCNFDSNQIIETMRLNAAGKLPERWVWINSFSKSRSLAGLRVGYLIGSPELVAFAKKENEASFWSPLNAGSTGLVADMVLRAMTRAAQSAAAPDRERAITGIAKQFGRYAKVWAPYREDFMVFADVWAEFLAGTDWVKELGGYQADLRSAELTYQSNWRQFESRMQNSLVATVPAVHGFNHTIKVATQLNEWEFCQRAFDETGIDFYTESVFSDASADAMDSNNFWIRISCAVDADFFSTGTEALVRFLTKG